MMEQTIKIPIQAVDWLLANHRWVREEFESVLFPVRVSIMNGLGGTGRGEGFVTEDPILYYAQLKEEYDRILMIVKFAVASLDRYQHAVYEYKFLFGLKYSDIKKAIINGQYRKQIGQRTLERTVSEIRERTMWNLEANKVRPYAVETMIERFGYRKTLSRRTDRTKVS